MKELEKRPYSYAEVDKAFHWLVMKKQSAVFASIKLADVINDIFDGPGGGKTAYDKYDMDYNAELRRREDEKRNAVELELLEYLKGDSD
jgi:hypothetical protein